MRLPHLLRSAHKWLGLVVGLQMALWTLTGAYMTAVHIDIIHGDHLVRTPPLASIATEDLIQPATIQQRFPALEGLQLQTWMGRPAYLVSAGGGEALVDARSGRLLSPVSEATVRDLARQWLKGEREIVRVELLSELPREVGGRAPPLWRVQFEGWNKPTFYFSPAGQLVTRRHELWRAFDLFWALHIMDYRERENINNPLLRAATVSAVLMSVSGAVLLAFSFHRRRAVRRNGPAAPPLILFRRLHKWVGLVLGVQVVLWTVSGAGMAILGASEVSGEAVAAAPEPPALGRPLAPLSASAGPDVTGVKLRPLLDKHVYEVRAPDGVRLVDAASGAPVAIDAAVARAVAAEHYGGDGAPTEATRLAQPNLETRESEGPLWRVRFDDARGTAVYISEKTGAVAQTRTDAYRLFDVLWMLHIMDYTDRQSFNHPLIWTFAAAGVWMSLTGLALVVLAFRRTDFTGLLRLGRPETSKRKA